jgi:hypothetical protein
MLVLVEIGAFMLVVDLLTCGFTHVYLRLWLLACYLVMVSS